MIARNHSIARRLIALVSVVALCVAAFAASCGGDDDDGNADATGAASTATASPLAGTITVYAASSLTEAFKEAGAKFQEAHGRTRVEFNFAASSALATQINEGAPADVFASADLAQMKNVVDKGNASESKTFVKNTPVVVVPKSGSPVAAFADMAKPGTKVVLAAPEVPIGKYSRDILTKASGTGGVSADFSTKVLANVVSNEANVRAVLTKVQLGEADAGIVYTTDIGAAANEVRALEVPSSYNVVAEYPIATVRASKNAAVADAFVAFILSPQGQDILKKYGFTPGV